MIEKTVGELRKELDGRIDQARQTEKEYDIFNMVRDIVCYTTRYRMTQVELDAPCGEITLMHDSRAGQSLVWLNGEKVYQCKDSKVPWQYPKLLRKPKEWLGFLAKHYEAVLEEEKRRKAEKEKKHLREQISNYT